MKKSLLILSIFIFTTLTANANDFMSKALDSWIGYSIDDVIAVWGYPKSEKQIAGRNLIYWTNAELVSASYNPGVNLIAVKPLK